MVGPVCESGDFLALDRDMPEPQPGDLLAVMTAGAYGAVQAGTYNTRALVPEVLVREGEWALVRPRLEVDGADRARSAAALAVNAAFELSANAVVLNSECLPFARWHGVYLRVSIES